MKKLIFILITVHALEGTLPQVVTYELSPGRFGDNLLSYIHAKWISYKYNIPLLYKPFVYSDYLVLHTADQWYTEELRAEYASFITLGKNRDVSQNDTSPTLYFVPYFPESKSERATGISFAGGAWDYFEVDWNDKGFVNELRRVISPVYPVKSIHLPVDRITVAVHVRRGGKHDTPVTVRGFPLKFLTDEFYIGWINWLYDFLGKKPLYVHIFTDDHDPAAIINIYRSCLKDFDITWGCREISNSETANVLDDFFALGQFDCLIHSESNFSFIMSKIANYKVSIYPDSFLRRGGRILYNHVNVYVTEYGDPPCQDKKLTKISE